MLSANIHVSVGVDESKITCMRTVWPYFQLPGTLFGPL